MTAGTARYSGAKAKYTNFAKTGNGNSLGGAMRRYVGSSGGANKAAQRMGASRAAGSRLLGLVRDAIQTGVDAALRVRGLQHLAGQPAEVVFAGIIDIVCPPGGPIDEAIARQALLDAIGDRADAGAEGFGAPTPEQLRELFLDFVIRSIEGKILSDIGANGVSLPSDVDSVIEIQDQVHDFISGCCRSHMPATLAEISGMTDRQLDGKVSAIYEAAFGLIKAEGEESE